MRYRLTSLIALAIVLSTIGEPQAQVDQGCQSESGTLPGGAWDKCVKAAIRVAARCETEVDLPDGPEKYGKRADCEEAAAKKDPAAKANPKVAEELRIFARSHRQLAKPGVSIGMTAQQVREETSWGAPRSVNRTITASGAREQWVYPGPQYLYFEDGRLVTIQQ
jgi:hypothetical protein